MNIERFEENSVTVLVFTGRFDTAAAPLADQALAEALDGGATHFVWDFAGVTFISSAGLRSVLQALKRVSPHGGKLAVCALSRTVLEVFDISGFKSLLTISPDRAGALAALR